MADAGFVEGYRAWIAGWRPDSELAAARAELHRFVSVLVSPGFKSVAERRQLAEFDELVRRLPWLISQERSAGFDHMAAALRALVAGPAPAGKRSFWNPPKDAFDSAECAQSDCDACYHFLNAVARQVLSPGSGENRK